MKPVQTRKLISGCAILLGVAWCVFVLFQPLMSVFQNVNGAMDLMLLLTLLPMLVPGVLLLCFGLHLYRAMSLPALKGVIGTVATLVVLFISSSIAIALPDVFPEGKAGFFLILLFSIVTYPFYVFVVQLLLRHLKESVPSKLSFLGKPQVMVVCWLIWLNLNTFLQNVPLPEDQVMQMLSTVLPIFVAYGVYRFSMRRLKKLQKTTAL